MSDDFPAKFREFIRREVDARLAEVLIDGASPTVGERLLAGAKPRKKRSPQVCRFPGCSNTAAPRYGMFCVELHKDLPRAEKAKHVKAFKAKQLAAASSA